MSTMAVTPALTPALRITRRGRAVLLALIATPIAVLIALVSLNGGFASAGHADGATIQYLLVQPGESLWDIASRIAPLEDPRDVIEDLATFNQLPSQMVMAGQTLGIPPKYSP